MLVECVARPELKTPVMSLIARVAGEHARGEFSIPLLFLFEAFGLPLSEGARRKLESRGAVSFTPRDGASGRFINRSGEQEIETGEGLILVIPQTLAGDYITTQSSLTLKFGEGTALRGCKRVFVRICQDVIKIDVDEHKLYIDLPGEKYDLCFVF
ncbi:MAG: hypothetical protein JO360_07685 [Acidobacteria bacterium]|nr:hypothetical protein [Acidobacteriota bacterium]